MEFLFSFYSDINECERSNPCSRTCHNSPGSFSCASCPKGYKGDGLRNGTGCRPNEKRNMKKNVARLSISLGKYVIN